MRLFEGAFLGFEEEGFSLEKVKDVMYNLLVEGRIVWSGDQDIVHVNKDHVRVLQFEGSEDTIHHALEGCWSIVLTK